MERLRVLRVAILVAALGFLTAGAIAAAGQEVRENPFEFGSGSELDAVVNSGGDADTVDIIAEINLGSSPTTGIEGDGGSAGGMGGPREDSPARPETPIEDFCSPVDPADCRMSAAEPEPAPAGEPAVTMRDIASFRPAEPGNGMEPGGWAVVGLPANFVAESSVQTLSGTLLGRPAEVRFHPVAYRWTHSDGAVVQTSTPGSTWEALGQAEFTETATSHVYAASGDYTVDIAVVFVAEYRFNGSVWRWIDGTLSVPGAPQSVLVGEFDTVLVTGDCRVAPDGPGC